jgi:spore coat polysaccharide biosynthesis protein SpsF (cytidylyltransferase family)
MKSAIFLSVRDKATRLPGKITAPICGRRAIEHLIDRLKLAKRADMVVMTTSVHPDDSGLVNIAENESILVFRGSEDDKLLRYLDAAKKFGVEFCIVVDGDDLFADPITIDRIVDAYAKSKADYIICDGLPIGVTGFGVRTAALQEVVDTKAESDTEVWGGYFANNPKFNCLFLDPPPRWNRPEWRMTLDYPEDLAFFTAVIEALYKPGQVFTFDEVVELLERRSDIAALNAGVKAKYEANLKKAAPVAFKEGA